MKYNRRGKSNHDKYFSSLPIMQNYPFLASPFGKLSHIALAMSLSALKPCMSMGCPMLPAQAPYHR